MTTTARIDPARPAALLPGQGAQFVGMGRTLCSESAIARQTFAAADEALGWSLSRYCFEGPEDALTATAVAQPALLAHSVAVYRDIAALGSDPAGGPPVGAAIGHSLGEWSALVIAGALGFEDAVRLVHLRGQLMQSATPTGLGAMAAIIGLSDEAVEAVCAESTAQHSVVVPATYNGAAHVVISGHAAAVARAGALARDRGALKVIDVAVSAPFHSPLMAPAVAPLANALADVSIAQPTVGVFSATTLTWLDSAEAIRSALTAQLTQPVRWVQSVAALADAGFSRAWVLGAGQSLARMVKRLRLPVRPVLVASGRTVESELASLWRVP